MEINAFILNAVAEPSDRLEGDWSARDNNGNDQTNSTIISPIFNAISTIVTPVVSGVINLTFRTVSADGREITAFAIIYVSPGRRTMILITGGRIERIDDLDTIKMDIGETLSVVTQPYYRKPTGDLMLASQGTDVTWTNPGSNCVTLSVNTADRDNFP